MNIDVKNMTKEQKQIAVLVGLVGVIAIYATVMFGIAPLKAKYTNGKAELEELAGKLERAERMIDRRDIVRAELGEISQELSDALSD